MFVEKHSLTVIGMFSNIFFNYEIITLSISYTTGLKIKKDISYIVFSNQHGIHGYNMFTTEIVQPNIVDQLANFE